MFILLLTLVIVACCTIYYYFKRKLSYFEDIGIPYVPGWPLFGNMASAFFRKKHISEAMDDVYYHHPEAKYVGAFDFVRPVIVIRDPELIKSINITNFDSFTDKKSFIDDTLDPLFGGSLMNMAGEKWKEARALLSPAFTSSKMKAMHESIVECAENFLSYLSKLSTSEKKMMATKELFTRFTNDVIATCAFGVKVNSFDDQNNDFYVLGGRATKLDGLMTIKFFISRSFPQLMRWFNLRFFDGRVENFFKNIVRRTVEKRDKEGINRQDMLQLMMNARGKGKNLKLDINEMTAQVFIFYFSGFDSASTQMCIITHELAASPTIQKRLQDEIDEVMRVSHGKPSYEDIQGMSYLDAIFNESLRRHSQASLLDRVCLKPLELPAALPGYKPFTLKPGMNVWMLPNSIHKDPKYHENPKEFNPDRYLGKKVTINDPMNVGFGIGPRSCIGYRFATLKTKMLIFHLLREFNLKPNVKTCLPMKYSKSTFSIEPEDGFWLDIEPRNEIS